MYLLVLRKEMVKRKMKKLTVKLNIPKNLTGEDMVCVCVRHPKVEMNKYEVTEKDGKKTEGVSCPKCYCINGTFITRKEFDTLNGKETK
jgi:hypothetical protein